MPPGGTPSGAFIIKGPFIIDGLATQFSAEPAAPVSSGKLSPPPTHLPTKSDELTTTPRTFSSPAGAGTREPRIANLAGQIYNASLMRRLLASEKRSGEGEGERICSLISLRRESLREAARMRRQRRSLAVIESEQSELGRDSSCSRDTARDATAFSIATADGLCPRVASAVIKCDMRDIPAEVKSMSNL